MKDAMLQLQMLIPSLKTNASFTAALNMKEDVLMDLETVINLPETSYQQKALLKYGTCQPPHTQHRRQIWNIHLFVYLWVNFDFLLTDDDKFELELKSDLNSDIKNLIPNIEDRHRRLQHLIDHILDQQVAMTDMKYRHIVTKWIEVTL